MKRSFSFALILLLLLFVSGSGSLLYGQIKEPPVRAIDNPTTPLQKGFSNRIGGSVFVNNFGFGIGGTFGHALGPYTEITFDTRITGIRDVSEQTVQRFLTGQRVIPDKFQRAWGFPFIVGIKKRIFPRKIADNFRFFVAAAGGPAMAFVYPYFNDNNNNGYRDFAINQFGQLVEIEEKNDFFSGWGDGSTEWGAAGEIKIGVDLGSFKQQSTLEIGYFFYYFDPGLQIMEPSQPTGFQPCPGDPDFGCPVGQEPFFDAQKFFGTPQIKFTFSGWW